MKESLVGMAQTRRAAKRKGAVDDTDIVEDVEGIEEELEVEEEDGIKLEAFNLKLGAARRVLAGAGCWVPPVLRVCAGCGVCGWCPVRCCWALGPADWGRNCESGGPTSPTQHTLGVPSPCTYVGPGVLPGWGLGVLCWVLVGRSLT